MTDRAHDDDLLQLPGRERARLAAKLLKSLEEEPVPVAEAAWVVEIERRAREVLAGDVELEDWDDVKARLLARAQRPE